MPRSLAKAFTLLEVLMALALGALLTGLTVVNLWPSRSSAGARGLADSLLEELRLARQTATSSGTPVGVALASGNRGPHSQSLYLLSGQPVPQLVRVRDFSREFPATYLSTATWTRSDGASWTRTQPKPMSNGDGFDPAGWTNPINRSDPVLIFTPSGSVTSNGLPLCNGKYYLVTSQGLRFQNATVPGTGPSLSYFSLQAVAQPRTLWISTTGSMGQAPGLEAPDSRISLVTRGFATVSPPAAPVRRAAPNTVPRLVSCQVFPKPPEGATSGTATLAPGQHLSLRVTAQDADGDELYCSWSANGGVFSSAAPSAMELQGTQWVSDWEWRPPPGVTTGSYALTCTVRDQRGLEVSGGALGSLSVALQPSGRVLFTACEEDSVMPTRLKSIALTGSGEVQLANDPYGWNGLRVSPDGTKLACGRIGMAFVSHTDSRGGNVLGWDPANSEFVFCLGPSFLFGTPAFSAEGTQLCFCGASNLHPSLDLYISDLQGSQIRRFTSDNNNSESKPHWSGDGLLIVYESENPAGDTEIRMKPAAGGPHVVLTAGLAGSQSLVSLCPNKVGGNYRLLYFDFEATHHLRVMDFDVDGNVITPVVGVINPSDSDATLGLGELSSDGRQVVYLHERELRLSAANGSGNVLLDRPPGESYDASPRFGPGNGLVVFWSNRSCSTPWLGDLYSVHPDGSSLQRITRGFQVPNLSFYGGWDVQP